MAKTYEELLAAAEAIRTNTLPDSNTADLVGSHLKDVINKDKETSDNLSAEIQGREAADNTIQQHLDAEANARANADNNLQENINQESQNRITAENALANGIVKETQDRTTADNFLDGKISQEKQDRQNADSALQQVDANLSDQINKLIAGFNIRNNLRPAAIALIYPALITIGATPRINVLMFPSGCNSSIMFNAYNNIKVQPDGTVETITAGAAKVYAVPSLNNTCYKSADITVRDVETRTTEDGTARTTEDDQSIEC